MKNALANFVITIAVVTMATSVDARPQKQTQAAGPHFEVASITPCKPGTPENPMLHMDMVQFVYPGGRFATTATSLKYLLEWAYDIQPSQHMGGPAWIDSDVYDIEAKAEGNPSKAEIKKMLQRLLAERFRLKLHQEEKNLSVYVLSVGKTPAKLTPVKDGEAHGMRFAPINGADQKNGGYHVIGTRYSVADLGTLFARQLGHVVVDKTGIEGEFDFTVDLVPDDNRPSPVDQTVLLTALREQLGLTVKAQTLPVNIFVIDSAEKVLAGN
jgi:uncharacterized protein (TIGR03435 family)